MMHIAIGTIAMIAGLCSLGYGGFSALGGGMSDAPSAGEAASKSGGGIALAGVALLGFGVWLVL